MIFGYCRVSTETQKIERQIENILTLAPGAKIFQEKFTGTTLERIEWQKLKKQVKPGDKIIFDSVSRMSRNSDEGAKEYFELMEKGIELEFIKEPYINTETYQEQLKLNDNIQISDNDLNETLIQGLREYLKRLAKKQIQIAFDQAEKEVQDLRQRTREGLRQTKMRGTILGRREGAIIITKKEKEMLEKIKKLSKDFNGTLKDKEILEILNLSRNTYYKYKKNIKIAMEKEIEE